MSQDPISLQDAYTEAVAEIERLRGLLALHEDARLHAIDRAVERFLCWNLPDDFDPDGGISFSKSSTNEDMPTGTCLLNARQAEEMFEHCLAINRANPRVKSRPGIDPCEVAAAVQTLRSIEVVNNVLALVGNWRECPFRYGFEQACEEIEFRLRNDEGGAGQDCARTKGGNA